MDIGFRNTRKIITLFAMSLAFAEQGVFAHGGDSHDVTPVHLLRGKILDDHQDDHEHSHSRFSFGLTGSSSQYLGDSRSKSSPESTNLDESRLSLALNYRASHEASLNFLAAFSSTELLQDPSIGSTYIRPIRDHDLQSISFAALAAPASIISREQGRLLTLNLSSGILATLGRWTGGVFVNFGLPIYNGAVRGKPDNELEGDEDALQHEEGSHQDGHLHTAERFLAGGSLKLGYRLGREIRLDALFDSTAKRLITNVTVFDTELTLAKICYLGTGWEAGIGFGWKEENGDSFHFPRSAISKLNLTVWR